MARRLSTTSGLFGVLGLDPTQELAYRHVLSVGSVTVTQLAAAMEVAEPVAAAWLERLQDLGLILPVDGTTCFASVDPRSALRSLTDSHTMDLNRLREHIPELASVFEDARRGSDAPTLTRLLAGHSDIADWYGRLGHEVEQEFLGFDRPPYVVTPTDALEELAISRGVVWRSVYGAASFDLPGRLDRVRRDVAMGERARVTAAVPVKLAIIDRRLALVSLNLSEEAPEALLTESPPLVEALCLMFESYWERAQPLRQWRSDVAHEPRPGTGRARDGRAPTAEERELLALLTAEVKDDVIARELGISVRTLGRRLRDLMDALGATSRFRAGAEAARRGWI
ncbi:hypothetical protein ACFQHV_10095 [Promicromonospora thailandica]|uniref:HTH luxR-type domain-containing protein n=1 Tax=Promicromonospora thailandica TaxID=765201 RepID=A0A9X2JW72_9MICO|nr:hypothetical protein [Promicromonospora thailandica]MCP2264828.1 hypothetical protein [Promicromonospora thailandica]BFF18919.1 LuxR family transcriptional regulator [Promicromonospora thailandica]